MFLTNMCRTLSYNTLKIKSNRESSDMFDLRQKNMFRKHTVIVFDMGYTGSCPGQHLKGVGHQRTRK